MEKSFDFRTLTPEEVRVRIAGFTEQGVQYLVYKQSWVDAMILDETVGPMNWQCEYSEDLKKCTIQIWDSDKKQWISKSDCGDVAPSAQCINKNLATDAFKRAGMKWGIGKELRSLPNILVACPTESGPHGFAPVDWKHPALYMPHVTEMVFSKDKKLKSKKLKKLEIRNGYNEAIFSYTAKDGIADITLEDKRGEEKIPQLENIPAIDFEDDVVFDIPTVEIIEPPTPDNMPAVPPQANIGNAAPQRNVDPAKDLKGFIRSRGGQA